MNKAAMQLSSPTQSSRLDTKKKPSKKKRDLSTAEKIAAVSSHSKNARSDLSSSASPRGAQPSPPVSPSGLMHSSSELANYASPSSSSKSPEGFMRRLPLPPALQDLSSLAASSGDEDFIFTTISSGFRARTSDSFQTSRATAPVASIDIHALPATARTVANQIHDHIITLGLPKTNVVIEGGMARRFWMEMALTACPSTLETESIGQIQTLLERPVRDTDVFFITDKQNFSEFSSSGYTNLYDSVASQQSQVLELVDMNDTTMSEILKQVNQLQTTGPQIAELAELHTQLTLRLDKATRNNHNNTPQKILALIDAINAHRPAEKLTRLIEISVFRYQSQQHVEFKNGEELLFKTITIDALLNHYERNNEDYSKEYQHTELECLRSIEPILKQLAP